MKINYTITKLRKFIFISGIFLGRNIKDINLESIEEEEFIKLTNPKTFNIKNCEEYLGGIKNYTFISQNKLLIESKGGDFYLYKIQEIDENKL